MVQSSGRLGLLLEALQPVGVLRKRRRQHLDRDVALQTLVARPVNLSHPARAERRGDLVRSELRSGGKSHFRSRTQYSVERTREKPSVIVCPSGVTRAAPREVMPARSRPVRSRMCVRTPDPMSIRSIRVGSSPEPTYTLRLSAVQPDGMSPGWEAERTVEEPPAVGNKCTRRSGPSATTHRASGETKSRL